MLDKRPNPAHLALAAIERWQVARGGQFLLVTQNVDPLHERAGSERLVKVHGSSDRVRCSRHGCVYGAPRGSLPRAGIDMGAFKAEPVAANVPRCPSCGSLLRQHVLWFDEFYDEHRDYQWERVLDAAQRMGTCLFVGTSFSVGVTDLFLRAGLMTGRPMLDRSTPAPPRRRTRRSRCSASLRRFCSRPFARRLARNRANPSMRARRPDPFPASGDEFDYPSFSWQVR